MRGGKMIFKNVELYNIEATCDTEGKEGVALSRYPERIRRKLEAKFPSELFCAGSEIRFNLEGGPARILLARDASGPISPQGICEVWFGPFQGDWQVSPRFISPEPAWIEIALPSNIDELVRAAEGAGSPWDPRLCRLILPYDFSCRLIDIQGPVSPPRAGQSPSRKLLAYGSSITHGGSAVRPTESWAMRLADSLGLDLINLGLAGNCRLEPAVAEWIAERRDWELGILELGINLIGEMEAPEFAARSDKFLSILAAARPEARIFCIDLFSNGADLKEDGKFASFRRAVKEAVAESGSKRISHIDGRSLLDPVRGLCESLLHPSARGHEEIAGKLARIVSAAP
jgi:hypothetical protein